MRRLETTGLKPSGGTERHKVGLAVRWRRWHWALDQRYESGGEGLLAAHQPIGMDLAWLSADLGGSQAVASD
jgi:hypothetical protein